jgi:hypothetical protein
MTLFDSPIDLAQDLMEDVRSLGLVSQDATTLKAFSHRVLASAKTLDAQVQIDKYNGNEFLNLISRLNQAVAPYLEQQAKPTDKLGPIHIWVIDEAERLSAEQQSIIFRLIELFPALPFRVIWLSNRPLQAWEDHANSESLLLDLDATPLQGAAADAPNMTPDPLDDALTETRDMPQAASAAMHWPAYGTGQNMKVAAGLAGAAVLAALAWWSTSTSAPSAPDTRAPAQAAASAASESAAAPAAVAASEAAALSAPASPAAAAPEVAKPEAPPKASAAPQAVPAPMAAPTAVRKALPEVARTGGRWLKALPADTLVVEHGTFSSAEQAQKLKAKYKELGTARIIAVRKAPNADEWQYSVVTGPFRSEDRAKTYVSRLDWKSSTRIRATDKLKPLVASAP